MKTKLTIFFTKKPLQTDPYPYLVKYSPDVLKKKTKVLDIFNTDKKCPYKDPFS